VHYVSPIWFCRWGQVGFLGAICHNFNRAAVTIPQPWHCRIATKPESEGGGRVHIIRSSWTGIIGTTIGIALYFSQAISVAFLLMAYYRSIYHLF